MNAFIEYFTHYLYRGLDVDECNVSNLFGSGTGHYPNVDNFKGHCSVSKVIIICTKLLFICYL